MDFGRIKRDALPITLREWNKVIASNAALEHVPDRAGVNPFTKKKVLFPGKGKANYVVDGKTIGNASLEDGEILTTGISRAACEEIARSLNAKVFKDDRS